MFTIRDQLRIAGQCTAAASQAVPPDSPQETAEQGTRYVQKQQEQQHRPCTRYQQEGQQHQQ